MLMFHIKPSKWIMVPSAAELNGDIDLIIQQNLAPDHWQKYQYIVDDNGISVLDWQLNCPEL